MDLPGSDVAMATCHTILGIFIRDFHSACSISQLRMQSIEGAEVEHVEVGPRE